MDQRKEYRALVNQLSVYELELQGKNHKKYLEVNIGTNNCNATIMLTKKELLGDNTEVIQTLKGFNHEGLGIEKKDYFIAKKTMQYSKNGMINDNIRTSLPLTDSKNILSMRRLYVTIYSKSFCIISITALGKDINPELMPSHNNNIYKKIKIHKFGRYGIYFRPGIREVKVEYLFPNEDMEFEQYLLKKSKFHYFQAYLDDCNGGNIKLFNHQDHLTVQKTKYQPMCLILKRDGPSSNSKHL